MIIMTPNNNTTTKGNNMTKKFLTAKETEGMTLEQFQAAMREGRVEVRRESMDNVTADMVTMNGRFSCD
jgi:regulatory protein YycI of two-component signal transduction system YycFG